MFRPKNDPEDLLPSNTKSVKRSLNKPIQNLKKY